jgi:hypothetical protein
MNSIMSREYYVGADVYEESAVLTFNTPVAYPITPTLAIHMLKAHKGEWKFDIDDIDALPPVNLSEFNTPLEQATKPLPFLYQAGYLTIKSYPGRGDKYILGVPNAEVRMALKQMMPSPTLRTAGKS